MMRLHSWLLFPLAVFVLGSAVSASSKAGSGPAFPLGVWYEGGVGEFRNNVIPEDPTQAVATYQRDFKDISAHGINCAVVPNTQPNHHKALLDAAGANGVKLIIELDKEGGELGAMIRGGAPVSREALLKTFQDKLRPVVNHPALWRVQLLDEPPSGTYDRYAAVAHALRKYPGGPPAFCCLAGVGSVDEFLRIARPDVAAFDHYPVGVGSPVGDPQPMRSFETAANQAAEAGRKYHTPIWAVLQTHAITGIHRFPTPAEIRCMTHLSLAAGCKGIFWFLYQTEYFDSARTMRMSGLVDDSFKGDARWTEVRKLCADINAISPVLLGLERVQPDGRVTCSSSAGLLKDDSGHLYCYAVNMDTLKDRLVEVRVKAKGSSVERLPSGRRIAGRRNGEALIWSDKLPPGGGALYRL